MTATGTVCGSCGAEPLENARFCHRCGAPVAAPGTHAEYKQVTVLFADVVRSMAIAAAVDMERLREIVTELVERSAAVVRRYGGSVEFTGDGVMASSAPRRRWRITPFAPAWRPWAFRRRRSGLPWKSESATVWTSRCGWD